MSKCNCAVPYTYGESLAKQVKDSGKLIAVAPMMGMDKCMRCYANEMNGTRKRNLDISKLARAMKEIKSNKKALITRAFLYSLTSTSSCRVGASCFIGSS